MDKSKSNGNLKNPADLDNKKINFPVTFSLKAVMEGTGSDEENKKKIVAVFSEFGIKYSYQNKKVSSKGTYTSFTYEVRLESKEEMEKLYARLKNVDGLKFAI